MSLCSSSLLKCIVAMRRITSLCVMLCRLHSSKCSFRRTKYAEKDSLLFGFSFRSYLLRLKIGLTVLKCVSRASKQLSVSISMSWIVPSASCACCLEGMTGFHCWFFLSIWLWAGCPAVWGVLSVAVNGCFLAVLKKVRHVCSCVSNVHECKICQACFYHVWSLGCLEIFCQL